MSSPDASYAVFLRMKYSFNLKKHVEITSALHSIFHSFSFVWELSSQLSNTNCEFYQFSAKLRNEWHCIQFVPLATEPSISLIILTPMKILQWNLNRSMFIVWEMKRNVSVVRLIGATWSSGPPGSQPVSCLTRLSADLSVIWLRVPTQYSCYSWVLVFSLCEFTQDSWKIYRYTVEEQVFIVRTYWKRESIKSCQQQFLEKFGGRHPPSKSSIWALSKKLETKGTLLRKHTGGRPKMSEEMMQNVKDRLLASPKKSLHWLSQESGLSRSTCQRAAKKAKLHVCCISVVHELKEPDQVKRVAHCRWFQTLFKENLGILDYTWFLDKAWFHLSGYVKSQNSHIWASENPNAIHEEPLHPEQIGVWCGMSWQHIIGPIFNATITTAAYMEIFNTFVNQLDDEELSIGYF